MPRIFGNRDAQRTIADAPAGRAGQNAATATGTPPHNARSSGSALGSLPPRGQQNSPTSSQPSPPRRGILARFLRRPASAGSSSGVPPDISLPHDDPNLPIARAVDAWSEWAQGRVDEVHPTISYNEGTGEMSSRIRFAAEVINAHAADSNLTRLELTALPVQRFPAALGRITHLKSLAVTMSEFKALPESIGNLQRLQTLSLSNNRN